jgi:sRNA-binding protein
MMRRIEYTTADGLHVTREIDMEDLRVAVRIVHGGWERMYAELLDHCGGDVDLAAVCLEASRAVEFFRRKLAERAARVRAQKKGGA